MTGVSLRWRIVARILGITYQRPVTSAEISVNDHAWGSVWLYGPWHRITKCMPTEEREHAANAVYRWMRHIDALDGEVPREEPPELRWWRKEEGA